MNTAQQQARQRAANYYARAFMPPPDMGDFEDEQPGRIRLSPYPERVKVQPTPPWNPNAQPFNSNQLLRLAQNEDSPLVTAPAANPANPPVESQQPAPQQQAAGGPQLRLGGDEAQQSGIYTVDLSQEPPDAYTPNGNRPAGPTAEELQLDRLSGAADTPLDPKEARKLRQQKLAELSIAPPNETPEERLQRLAERQAVAAQTVQGDSNGRVKSFLKMMARSVAAYAGVMAQQPNQGAAGFAQLIGAALGGGAVGLVNPDTDELLAQRQEAAKYGREYEEEAGRQEQQVQLDKGRAANLQTIANARKTNAEALAVPEELRLKGDKLSLEAENDVRQSNDRRRDDLVQQYNSLDTFDPDAQDEQTRNMMQIAKDLGWALPKKEKGEQWQTQIAPDGTVIQSKKDGTLRRGVDEKGRPLQVAKPSEVRDSDFPDELFGIPSSEQIRAQARAGVAKGYKSRRVRPELLYEGSPYRNEDGSPNMERIIEAIQDKEINSSDAFQDAPDNSDQMIARAESNMRGAYSERVAQKGIFMQNLRANRPNPDGPKVSRTALIERWNAIMAIKDKKQRTARMKAFYEAWKGATIE